MADRILGTLLKSLERVYRFPSAQKGSPSDFELDLPIQPVHDMSQMAEVGSGVSPVNDGLWVFTRRHEHVANGTISSTPSVWDTSIPVANGFIRPAQTEYAWWIFDSWCYGDDQVDYSAAYDGIAHGSASVGPYIAGASLQRRMLHYWTTITANGGIQGATEWNPIPYPIRVLDNQVATISSYWFLMSTAAVGGTINVDFNMMFGMWPRGVLAPGAR